MIKLKMSSGEEKKKLQKSYFDVVGLCCSSEVPLIENILKPLQGIKEVSVIVPSRTVIVVHDTLVISQLQIGNLLSLSLWSYHIIYIVAFHIHDVTSLIRSVFITWCCVDDIKLISSYQRLLCGCLNVNVGFPFFDNDWTTLVP